MNMKVLALLPLALCLTGCPSGSQQDAAKASLQVTIVMQSAQQAEIAARNQGVISDSDHRFIQQQFINLGRADKAANDCIENANNKGAVIACLNTAVNAVNQSQQEGTLGIKSDNAKATFTLAVTSIKGVLEAIIASFGGAQ